MVDFGMNNFAEQLLVMMCGILLGLIIPDFVRWGMEWREKHKILRMERENHHNMLCSDEEKSSILFIKKLSGDAKIPTKSHPTDAGFDLYSCKEVKIYPGEIKEVPMDIAMEIPEGFFGAIFARSGLGSKGIRPANCTGVVDAGYRGAVKAFMINDSKEVYTIQKHERVCQLVLIPFGMCEKAVEVEELASSDRGTGGFGSTGK